jgi:hypothetical protein
MLIILYATLVVNNIFYRWMTSTNGKRGVTPHAKKLQSCMRKIHKARSHGDNIEVTTCFINSFCDSIFLFNMNLKLLLDILMSLHFIWFCWFLCSSDVCLLCHVLCWDFLDLLMHCWIHFVYHAILLQVPWNIQGQPVGEES